MYEPRERRLDLSLKELGSASLEFSTALRSLRWLLVEEEQPQRVSAPEDGKRSRGRPRRSEQLNPDFVESAPVPEIALAPAQDVPAIVTSIDNIDLLARALTFELKGDNRKSVARVIERRIRALQRSGPGGFSPLAPQERE